MSELFNRLDRVRVENMTRMFVHPPYMLECELDKAMTDCNRAKSLELLHSINSLERARLADTPLRSLQLSLVCGCTCYTRTAIHAGVDAETAFDLSDLFIREISETRSVQALTELECRMLMDFIDLIERSSRAKVSDNKAVNRMIAYIQANINHRITLADIASAVGLHPVYVSALFTEKTGMPVTAFINTTRINAIKSFLEESDMKMLELSELFSFSSAAHFSSYFKKYTGQTPREYRSSHLRNSIS